MEKSPARWWDLPSATFLFFAILFSTWRLQETEWTEGLIHVWNIALLGLMVGLALGQSMYQKRGVILLTAGYMLTLFTWQLLGMMEFGKEETYLGDKLIVLAGRIFLGVSEFAAGRPVKDPLFFVALFFIPYWCAALYSGFQLTRHANPLAAILPNGILMFVIYFNHYTTRDTSWLFGLYLFMAFLLMGRQKYLRDREIWRERHVQISPESGVDFNNTIMVSAAVLIILAWMAPSSVLTFNSYARKTWQSISKELFPQNDRLENIFAAAKKENIPVSDVYRSEMALGTQASQSAEISMLVFPSSPSKDLPRLYWRGHVYDSFEGGRWLTSSVTSINYEAQDGDFLIEDAQNRLRLDFTFNVYTQGQAILYTASQPIFVSHPANIIHKIIPTTGEDRANIEGLDDLMDISALRSVPKLEAGESYHSSALVANPSIAELRAAGSEYPSWVTDRYLQLPEDFSVRIRKLAEELTADQDNPYDKTAAITNHLRSEIEYEPTISFPDGTTDRLEYFLFDVKKGFCNYYASAETLMLRSIGIPARLAVGYAQGEMNVENTFYTVRERDSHAWPEVYFPGYGWIEFEPTGNQATLERPLEAVEEPSITPVLPEQLEADPITQDKPTADETTGAKLRLTQTQLIQISLAAGFIVLAALIFYLKRRYAPNLQTAQILKTVVERSGWETPQWLNRWVRWTELTPIERSFQSVNTALRWMDKPPSVDITPAERASLLTSLLPSASADIESVLREHQSALFTRRGGDALLARRAARNILYQVLYLHIKNFVLGYNHAAPPK